MPSGLVQGGVDLDAVREKIQAQVPDKYKVGFNSIMAAGMKVMFSPQTFPQMKQYLDGISSPSQVPPIVAHGTVKLMSILMNMSKGHLPMEPSGAAAQALMTHALDYVKDVKGIPIDKDTLAATTQATNQGMMSLLQQYSGLSQDQFQQLLRGNGKALLQSNEPLQQGQAAPPQQSAPAPGGQDATAAVGA